MNPDEGPPPDEGRHDPWLEAGVSRVEDGMGEVRGTLRRMAPIIIAGLRQDLSSGIAGIKVALVEKPSRIDMWGIMTAMVAAFAHGLAGLAVVK
jgi:hypothetical protein